MYFSVNAMPTKILSAIWTPAWYELDQSLVLGERQKYWFFQNAPEPVSVNTARSEDCGHFDLFFFNQLDSTENCCVRYARIVEMYHPVLGPLLRVDTDGLDYIFYPVDGEEIVVNAEETPGEILCEEDQPTMEVHNWTVFVKLADVSEPAVNVA